MTKPPFAPIDFATPAVDIARRADGSMILTNPEPLGDYPRHTGELLRRWAEAAPDRTFLAERAGDDWRRLSYADALTQSEAVAQGLLDLGLGPERPLMILSGNSINQALVTLGAMLAGVPVAPVSPAYSLMSSDYAKVRHIFELLSPGLIYVERGSMFEKVLASLPLDDVAVVAAADPPAGLDVTALDALLAATPGRALAAAEARIEPDDAAKILFTSGSTGMPKGVVNTHRMMWANQQQGVQVWPFYLEEPPVMVDWLPWNHTFGSNFNFNHVLYLGGSMYLDAGKPTPDLIAQTVRNLAEISPTEYCNVPIGFSMLLDHLERDADLRATFYKRLKLIFYAGSALPQDLWERLDAVAIEATGKRVPMISAWGSTETAPLATAVHWQIESAGVIGLPVPGVELKMLPNGDKLEMRVRGPNVMPGYLNRPDLTADAFDDEGFYKIGDAGRFVDPDDPIKGLVFDGRVTEDFKLITGTWVHVGGIRVAALAAATPVLQDAVVAGHDRDRIGLLAWPNVNACKEICTDPAAHASVEALIRSPEVIDHLRQGIAAYNAKHRGSSTRIARVLLMAEPPNIDANEITDKGYINQRATLDRRAALVECLFADPPPDDVIEI